MPDAVLRFGPITLRRSRPFALRRLLPLLNLLAAALLLMGTAFADGRPSVFYDSDSYDLAGRNLIEIIRKAPESLSFKMQPGLDIGDDPVTSDGDIDPNMMGARSAWYGLFMHGLWQVGTLWLVAAAQALIAAWVIRLIWRAAAPKAPAWSYLALVGAMTLVSTLPFFATFAMPDVFAGIESAAIVLAMIYWDRLERWEIALLWVLLAACMSFHGSDPILAVPLVLGSALLAWRLGASFRGQMLRAAYVGLALVVGVGALKAYGWAYERRSGSDLRPPPFIMARLLVDGPGKRYLLKHCTDDVTPFVVCRYRFQPMNDTDLVLWSDEYDNGVWNIADAKRPAADGAAGARLRPGRGRLRSDRPGDRLYAQLARPAQRLLGRGPHPQPDGLLPRSVLGDHGPQAADPQLGGMQADGAGLRAAVLHDPAGDLARAVDRGGAGLRRLPADPARRAPGDRAPPSGLELAGGARGRRRARAHRPPC